MHKGTSGTFSRLPLFEAFLRDRPQVGIVISSSWRNADRSYLERLFSPDLRDRLCGRTVPEGSLGDRAAEVRHWARANRLRDFIALDDDPHLFPGDPSYLLPTDPSIGLTEVEITILSLWADLPGGQLR